MHNPFKKKDKTVKCFQCDKPAVIKYGEGKEILLLCLDCNLKYQQAIEMAQRRNAEMINYLTGQMESQVGMYGMFPRYQVTSPVIHKGDIKLNNINVSNSIVGAINTGVVQSIDVSLSVIKNQGEPEVVDAIKSLTEQLIKSNDINETQKNDILEQLSFVSDQLAKPKESRKWSLIKPVFTTIGSALSGFSNLLSAWEKLRSLIGI
jgi:hypothetical protein